MTDNYKKEIILDSLEEFTGFGGVGKVMLDSGCDTDGLYVFAYKKCPYVPIIPPELDHINSDSVQMLILYDQSPITI